jgi:hypothetical protein
MRSKKSLLLSNKKVLLVDKKACRSGTERGPSSHHTITIHHNVPHTIAHLQQKTSNTTLYGERLYGCFPYIMNKKKLLAAKKQRI